MTETPDVVPPCPIGVLPRPGQSARVLWQGEVLQAEVVWAGEWHVHLRAVTDLAHLEPRPEGPARLVWRGEHHAVCIDGQVTRGHDEWMMRCDPASLSTLEERARRRVAVRAPAQVSVPTRLSPQVAMTWSINVSEGGAALEPVRGFSISPREPLVVRLGFDDVPVLAVGRVVSAEPAEPVRVAFERMSPSVRDHLIQVVNCFEALSRAHAR